LAVIDDMIRAKLLDPAFRLRARRRGDDDQPGRLGKLNADRANTPPSADDQDRLSLVGTLAIDAETVEESLIGGDRRQRQRCGFGKTEALRLESDNALIDQLELRIGTRAGKVAGVIDFIAGLEQRDLRADGLDNSAGIPAKARARTCRPTGPGASES